MYESIHPNRTDLTNCDREPIHIPGKVQSHGFLVAVNAESHIITYISENIRPFTTREAASFLDQPVEKLEEDLTISNLPLNFSQILRLADNKTGSETINPCALKLGEKSYNLIVSQSGNEQVMEFEPETSGMILDLQRTIGRSVSGILSGKNLTALLQNTAREIKNIIRYDRVMIYKFNEDGHGAVVSEAKNEDLEPFLGLHYPASDIPKQARELYKVNLTRIIADAGSESSGIITHKREDEPLDMTHSELRAVSPIHIQYLKNMGVASSFSISILVNNELWGLIACHNLTPRFISYKARDASKIIGQILSSAIELRQEEESIHASEASRSAVNELIGYVEKDDDLVTALTGHAITIKDIIAASGAVLLFDGKVTQIGTTPDKDQIEDIINWLILNMDDALYSSNSFPQIFHSANDYSRIASGILVCMLSKEMKELIIWFKPEKIAEVNWAGNPSKSNNDQPDGLSAISPRKSFESYIEIVRNTSEKWSNADIAAVIKIREQIIYTIIRKANQIRLLNERLSKAYEELDTFSYTVSHDLRSPLSSIKNYAELLSASNYDLDDRDRMKMLERIIFCADKMNHLIKEILRYSKMARTDVSVTPIDMKAMLHEIKTEVINDLKAGSHEFHMGDTPSLQGDTVMINQVFTNLIHNAVKYSARAERPKVMVSGLQNDNEVVYSISDNGIGIDISSYNHVFELFKRMDNVKDFEGTGVGLAIVKRIVERHKGRIWFDSTLGVGTVFYVAFRNNHDEKALSTHSTFLGHPQ